MARFRRQACVAVAVMAGASMSVGLPAGSALAAAPLPIAVTAGAMATPQTDGIVFSVVIVGNTVYAGGRFSKVRPAGVAPGGTGEVTRNNLMAFDLTTGALLPWAPVITGTQYSSSNDPGPFCKTVASGTYVCDTVFRIKKSPDGSRIYVGGDFDFVNGVRRSKIAAFKTSDNSLDTTFAPVVAGRVRGISATADTVYLGGGITSVNGTARSRLAAVSTTGALKSWAPVADGEVFAVQAAPTQGRVILGGGFDNINGVRHRGYMSVDQTTGANAPWQATVPSGTETVTDIATDGTNVYFGAYDYGGKSVRYEGRSSIDIATGKPNWYDGCFGDTQSVTVSNGIVYSGSHTHDCSAINAAPENGPVDYYRLVAETATATGTATKASNHVKVGDPVPTMLPWFPNTNGGPTSSYWKNGPWAMDSNANYVVVGGEFTTVNGQAQQSLIRFAARGVSGAVNNGPQTPFPAPKLSKPILGGSPTVTWNATWDAQNDTVRYDVYRSGTSSPIYSVSQSSRPWSTPELKYTDTAVSGGTYYIKAVDADGKSISSPTATIN